MLHSHGLSSHVLQSFERAAHLQISMLATQFSKATITDQISRIEPLTVKRLLDRLEQHRALVRCALFAPASPLTRFDSIGHTATSPLLRILASTNEPSQEPYRAVHCPEGVG